MGMALAKRQQAMIEQFVEQQRQRELEDLKTKGRGRAITSAGQGISTFSPKPQNSNSLVVHHGSSTPQYLGNTANGDRKFI